MGLDTVQQEQLKAIGAYLSAVRQEQSRSLEEIAAKTYIPLRLLKAIEAGQEKPLPEPVFIQGFIRRYGDALGLDGMDLSQKFPVHVTPLPMTPAAAAVSQEPHVRTMAEPSFTSAPREAYEPSNPPQPATQSTSYLPYVAAAGLLAAGGLALAIVSAISSRQADVDPQPSMVLPQQPDPVTQTSPSPSPQAAAPKPSVSPSASPSVSPSAVRSASPSPRVSPRSSAASPSAASPSAASPARTAANNAPVSVALNLTGESWVQVIVDGEIKAEGVLPKGTRQNWSGQREIIVFAGNAGAVSVSQNGGAAKVMGALGDVTEARFVPKSN